MKKEILVSFSYDTETDTVSGVKVVNSVEKKKTTRKKKEVEEEVSSEPLVTREEAKLVFNTAAANLLGLEPGDRVIIKYEKKDNIFFPIIGKNTSFDEEGGNKLTKSNTIVYRGNANTILSEYGTEFSIEEFSDKIYKLVSTDGTVRVEQVIEKAEKVEPDMLIEGDETYSIETLNFEL